MTKQWFALQVHTGRERWIASFLSERGFHQLLLLQKNVRQWSDRSKTIETPVFPGYVFCQFPLGKRAEVLAAPGVLRVAGMGRVPEPIAEEEIYALQRLYTLDFRLEPWPFLREGDLVRIEEGPLSGITGRFVETKKNRRIIVSVSILERSVAAEVDKVCVTTVSESGNAILARQRPTPEGVQSLAGASVRRWDAS
jgi:transcription antitermination factor NusG